MLKVAVITPTLVTENHTRATTMVVTITTTKGRFPISLTIMGSR